tara:strand:- start:194 stop:397 length:204 start_codon:yes stop_codon:yes gene_type:complete
MRTEKNFQQSNNSEGARIKGDAIKAILDAMLLLPAHLNKIETSKLADRFTNTSGTMNDTQNILIKTE